MGGELRQDASSSSYQRETVVKDLDGNVIGRDGSGSRSGSFNASGSGSYENSRGSGSWDLSVSYSYSASYSHEWRPKTKSPVNPENPVDPSPEPILVNPCDCCDCGDGAVKVPVTFQNNVKEVKTISAVLAQTDSCAAVTCDCEALADVCSSEFQ